MPRPQTVRRRWCSTKRRKRPEGAGLRRGRGSRHGGSAVGRRAPWRERGLQNLSAPLQTALFLGGLVLLPALLVCLTPFTRIVIVLSFVRRAVTA